MSVRVAGLSKQYGRDAVLRDIDLTVSNGEFLALLGPSGAGKTTLLRLIAGLDVPDRGQILVDGAELRALPPRDRRIGFVFQNYALFRHMNAAANIAFGLTVKPRRIRPSRSDIAARVSELLDLMQLSGLGHRFPAQLSGGQRQRVALARALALDPKVLLLDEPFGALDAKVRAELREWLRHLQKQLGLTTVLVTHDRQEAFQLADRVAILQAGRIEQVGTVAEIKNAPATIFVAEFLDLHRSGTDLATNNAAAEPVNASPQENIILPRKRSTANVTPLRSPLLDAVPGMTASAPGAVCSRSQNGDASPDTPSAGELRFVALPNPDAELSQCQERALKAANVVVYDRHLAEIVSRVLPLGHYAERATGLSVNRCLDFARDGWSVVRLIDAEALEKALEEAHGITTAARYGTEQTDAQMPRDLNGRDADKACFAEPTSRTPVTCCGGLHFVGLSPLTARGASEFTANGLAG